MAKSENCPNCGAEVVFRSSGLPAVICDYCHSTVKRIGEALEKIGEVAALPFDVSPIQRGTTGKYDGRNFEVIGRIRLGYEQGSWNDWLCLFSDMTHGWLSESDGQFQMVIEQPLESSHSDLVQRIAAGGDAVPGDRTEIDGQPYFVADARWARCISAEGELPFAATTGWSVYNVDFRNPAGLSANVEREEGEPPGFYMGRYVSLAELEPRYLREIQGWARPEYAA
ncbi:MAG: DUF4178 domain-containing protein [Parasphingopyxis sp.]|uniref:DUF4178 domain-containing protein n=1 Tax=Parasphingopyxis sp. TaxID=1920299 RepID=UPI002617144F|nr:DUF4178 domain-containing protein [uncultured Parasphingopyxis sp.]